MGVELPQQQHGLHPGSGRMPRPAVRHRQEDPAAGYGAAAEPGPPPQLPGPAQRLHSGTHDRWDLNGKKG